MHTGMYALTHVKMYPLQLRPGSLHPQLGSLQLKGRCLQRRLDPHIENAHGRSRGLIVIKIGHHAEVGEFPCLKLVLLIFKRSPADVTNEFL